MGEDWWKILAIFLPLLFFTSVKADLTTYYPEVDSGCISLTCPYHISVLGTSPPLGTDYVGDYVPGTEEVKINETKGGLIDILVYSPSTGPSFSQITHNGYVVGAGSCVKTDAGNELCYNTSTFSPKVTVATPSRIKIYSPSSWAYSTDSVNLKVTTNGTIETWKYNLDGGANQTFTPNITLTGLSDGDHTVNVYAKDSQGNIGSNRVSFMIDTTSPSTTDNDTITGWINEEQTIGLECDDDVVGCDNTTYWKDGVKSVVKPNIIVKFTDSGNHTLTYHSADKVGNLESNLTTYIGLDFKPPKYSNDQDDSRDSVVEGRKVNVSVFWEDLTSGLDTVEFYTNQSGSWTLKSTCSYTSISGWCNKTIDTSKDEGEKVCWRQYTKDKAGNLNNSMENTEHCFDVTANKSKKSHTYWVEEGSEGNGTSRDNPAGNITYILKKYNLEDSTINVEPGEYNNATEEFPLILNYNNLTLKSTLGPSNTVIKGIGRIGIQLNADDVSIKGFTLKDHEEGIFLNSSNNSLVEKNRVIDNGDGIFLLNSTSNKISDNDCFSNYGNGIKLKGSNRNSIPDNNCSSNTREYGIMVEGSNNNSITNNICSNNIKGIWLSNSNNNTLINNSCLRNAKEGIELLSSNYTKVLDNMCSRNKIGVFLENSKENKVFKNNFSKNKKDYYGTGIKILDSGYNEFSGNVIFSNEDEGIILRSSNNNTIDYNKIKGGRSWPQMKYGIMGRYSDGNKITNNIISNNRYRGIQLYHSDKNLIRDNWFSYNEEEGIWLRNHCDANLVYNNSFFKNNGAGDTYDSSNMQASDGSGNNYWNSSSFGNYWNDWTEPDWDEDGIVDDSYAVEGSDSYDYYPLTSSPYDQVPPNVTILSPKSNQTLRTGEVIVNWTGSDDKVGIYSYEIKVDNGSWTDIESEEVYACPSDEDCIVCPSRECVMIPGKSCLLNLDNENHTVVIRAIDKAGNINTSNVSFEVDAPEVYWVEAGADGSGINESRPAGNITYILDNYHLENKTVKIKPGEYNSTVEDFPLGIYEENVTFRGVGNMSKTIIKSSEESPIRIEENSTTISGFTFKSKRSIIDIGSSHNLITRNKFYGEWKGIQIDGAYWQPLIENRIINNTFFGSGLSIRGSVENVIRNNQMSETEDIEFYKAHQNLIADNNITMRDNWNTFRFYESDNNTIKGNNFIEGGLYLSDSNRNNISDNLITEKGRPEACGIRIRESSSNRIKGNEITDKYQGIRITGSDYTSSEDNLIKGNIITKNEESGVFLNENTKNNKIYKNDFLGNGGKIFIGDGENAMDDGKNNHFNSSDIGNYWGDYNGSDSNNDTNDTIGDAPYNISGKAGSWDYLPSMKPFYINDTTPPLVNITYPKEGEVFNTSEVTIRWEGSDNESEIDYYRVRWDYVENTNYTGYFGFGNHTVEVKAVDEIGSIGSDTVSFKVDNLPEFAELLGEDSHWDKFQLPSLILENTTLENHTTSNVLSSIEGNYKIVYYFNGENWMSYSPNRPINDLTEFNDTSNKPYWIYMNKPAELVIE